MLGLTLEKLFVVAIVAGVVIGPQRLPGYAAQLADTVRALRRMVESARHDVGWEPMDVRQYHPRRIVRDALADPVAAAPPVVTAAEDIAEQASRVRPGQRYLVVGDAAHPRRVAIDSLPADDPRRLAAVPVGDWRRWDHEEHDLP